MKRCPICGAEYRCLCRPRRRKELRQQIRQGLSADPTCSSHTLAAALGTDHKTVLAVRKEMVSIGEIPQCSVIGKDGRTWEPTTDGVGTVSDDWGTDPEVFSWLHSIFGFSVDACASKNNALLSRYWTRQDNALSHDWSEEIVYCNPPFRLCCACIHKAATAKTAVVLFTLSMITRRDFLIRSGFRLLCCPRRRLRFRAPGARRLNSGGPYVGTLVAVWGRVTQEQMEALKQRWEVFRRLGSGPGG